MIQQSPSYEASPFIKYSGLISGVTSREGGIIKGKPYLLHGHMASGEMGLIVKSK